MRTRRVIDECTCDACGRQCQPTERPYQEYGRGYPHLSYRDVIPQDPLAFFDLCPACRRKAQDAIDEQNKAAQEKP